MKKLAIAVAVATLLFGSLSARAEEGMKGGLGFHSGLTPFDNVLLTVSPVPAAPTLGVRQWLSEQFGVDLGVGFNQYKVQPGDRKLTGYVFEVGVPISLKKASDKVNFIVRPGFQWGQLEDKDPGSTPTTITYTTLGVTGELEAEWMVAENLSISAAHGFGWFRQEDNFNPKTTLTSVGSTGSNFTQLGFHVYLW